MIVLVIQKAGAVVFWLNVSKSTGANFVQTDLVLPFVNQEKTISLQVKRDDSIVGFPVGCTMLTKVVPSECLAHIEAVLEAPLIRLINIKTPNKNRTSILLWQCVVQGPRRLAEATLAKPTHKSAVFMRQLNSPKRRRNARTSFLQDQNVMQTSNLTGPNTQ